MASAAGNTSVLERPPPAAPALNARTVADVPMEDVARMNTFNDTDIKENSKSKKSNKTGSSVPKLYGFYLEKVAPLDGTQLSWRRVSVTQLPYSQEELDEERANAETVLEAFPDLTSDQQGVINRMVEERQAKEKGDDVQWTVDGIQTFQHEKRRRIKWLRKKETETERLLVILKRGRKKATPPAGKLDAKSSSKTPVADHPGLIDLSDPPPIKKSKKDKSKNKDAMDPINGRNLNRDIEEVLADGGQGVRRTSINVIDIRLEADSDKHRHGTMGHPPDFLLVPQQGRAGLLRPKTVDTLRTIVISQDDILQIHPCAPMTMIVLVQEKVTSLGVLTRCGVQVIVTTRPIAGMRISRVDMRTHIPAVMIPPPDLAIGLHTFAQGRRPSPRPPQRREFMFDDDPTDYYPIVPRGRKSGDKPKARFDDPIVRSGPEITEMSESVHGSDVKPAPSSTAGSKVARTSGITATQDTKESDAKARQDKPHEESPQVTAPVQRQASFEDLAQDGRGLEPDSNPTSTNQYQVSVETRAKEETAAIDLVDSTASSDPRKNPIERLPERKKAQTSEEHLRAPSKPAVLRREPFSQPTDSGSSVSINRDSFLDGFASRCLQSLGRESARAWFEFDEAVEEVEQLLEIFALMMHRGSTRDSSLKSVTTLVSQNFTAIAEKLRDLAFKGDDYALPQRSQPESDSIVEWLFADSAKRHERQYVGETAGQQDMNEESSLGRVTVTLNFHWLMERMEKLSTLSETGPQFAAIRASLASRICDMRASDSLMMALDWDPMAFLEQQFGSDSRDICQTIVYCGVARAAYACTAAEYVKAVWPHAGPDAIGCVRDACSSTYRSSKRTIQGVNVEIRLASGKTFVCIAANEQAANEALEIAEVCVWLATACRAYIKDGGQAYCTTQLELVSDPETGFDLLQTNITYDDIDSERLATMGSCWLKMMNNPVIAKGYPIPMRSDPSQQQGLEASLELMVSLAHAAWATVFGATFLLKGMVSALLPILELEKSLVWHFVLAEDGGRLTYDDVCTRSVTPHPLLLTPDDLQDRRHFIGLWSPAVRIAAGSNDNSLYTGLKLSNSKKLDYYTGTLSNLSCSLGKFININAGFTIGKKDTSAALRASETRPFETRVGHASQMNVLFYGTWDRRGWLLDGASALMHLARLWMACDGNGSEHMERNALEKLCYSHSQGGRKAAIATLVENKNRDIGIFTSTRRQDEEIRTIQTTPRKSSGSSSRESSDDSHQDSRTSTWKRENKKATSEWTFERLVVDLFQILEAMHDKLSLSKIHAPEMTMKMPSCKPTLAGWETLDILKNRGPFEPRGVELKQGAGQWIEWARETSSIVLLARTFDELIVPVKQAGGCRRTSLVPTRKDLLAVPLYIWKSTSERWMYDDEDCSKGCIQISDDSYWHTFQPTMRSCSEGSPCTCDTVSKLGKKPTYTSKKGKSSIASVNVFKKYPHGAAIIGDVKERVSFIASLQTSTVLQQISERASPGLGIHTRKPASSNGRSDYAVPSASSDKSTMVSRWNSSHSSPYTCTRSSETQYSGSDWQRPPSHKLHGTRPSSSAEESVPDADFTQERSNRGSNDSHRISRSPQRPRIMFEDDLTLINGLAAAAESASALYDRTENNADDSPQLPLLISPRQSGKFNGIPDPNVSTDEVGSDPESLTSARTRGSLRRVSKASWGADGLKSMFRDQAQQQ